MGESPQAPSANGSDSICCETLERLGELRSDRINNPGYMYRAVLIYAPLVGALGLLSGYALYFQAEPILHLHSGAGLLFIEISIAVALGAASEWIRQVIDEGVSRLPSHRPVLITTLTLFLFEIFVISIHNIVISMRDIANTNAPDTARAIHDVWPGNIQDFLMVALLWTISGAGLTFGLSRLVFLSRRGLWAGARSGALFGGGIAAAGVLGYMLVARAAVVGSSILVNHQQWHALLSDNRIASLLGREVDYLLDARPYGRSFPVAYIVLFFAAAAVFRWSWKAKSLIPIGVLLIGVVTVLGLAVVDFTLIELPAYVWLAWSIPGALLGAMVPWLRSRTRLPHRLGVGLFALALLTLTFTGLLRLSVLLMLLPPMIFVLSGIEIMKNKQVKEYWPLVALSIAMIMCAVTPLQLNLANFRGIFGNISGFTATGPIRNALFGAFAPPKTAEAGKAGAQQTQGSDVESKGEQEQDVLLLQLCIICALGFWVTVGLLVCWSIQETHERTSIGHDGKERCFWVRERSQASIHYHDVQHGVLPKNDHDLFTRFALELLTGGAPWTEVNAYSQIFAGFIPETVAQMDALEVRKQLRQRSSAKTLKSTPTYGVTLVIENAKRVQAFCVKEADTTLIDALQAAAASGPETVVHFFRSTFNVKRDFAVGSFLQATGFLPGAHFRGCWRYSVDFTSTNWTG